MTFDDILKLEDADRYRFLSRMKSDCEYYLGYGNRQPKHLWGCNEVDHIAYMKALWNSFADSEKPEWLTYEQLLDYEKKMGVPAVLVEVDYKGYYLRFALTPEEFKKEFPETVEHLGLEKANSDTIKPLVHIWFEPCVVGDDAWKKHFHDMTYGLPDSDIEKGNYAYIDRKQMQSLSQYLKDIAIYHCRAVFQHDNMAFAENEIRLQTASAFKDMDCKVTSLKCVEEGPADGAGDFPDDKFFTFEFDLLTGIDSMVDVKAILDGVDGGEVISVSYVRSEDLKLSLEENILSAQNQVVEKDNNGLFDRNFEERS